jgi:hypothetical protein
LLLTSWKGSDHAKDKAMQARACGHKAKLTWRIALRSRRFFRITIAENVTSPQERSIGKWARTHTSQHLLARPLINKSKAQFLSNDKEIIRSYEKMTTYEQSQ